MEVVKQVNIMMVINGGDLNGMELWIILIQMGHQLVSLFKILHYRVTGQIMVLDNILQIQFHQKIQKHLKILKI